jgi:hypothetical protein
VPYRSARTSWSWIVSFLAAAAILVLLREIIMRLFALREPRVQVATMFKR